MAPRDQQLLAPESGAAARAQPTLGGGQQQLQQPLPAPQPAESQPADDIGELLLSRLLVAPGGRKRLDSYDLAAAGPGSGSASPVLASSPAGTPRKGGSPLRRRSAGGRLQTTSPPRAWRQQQQQQQAPEQQAPGGSEAGSLEEDDLVVESFWESPVFVSMLQELLAW